MCAWILGCHSTHPQLILAAGGPGRTQSGCEQGWERCTPSRHPVTQALWSTSGEVRSAGLKKTEILSADSDSGSRGLNTHSLMSTGHQEPPGVWRRPLPVGRCVDLNSWAPTLATHLQGSVGSISQHPGPSRNPGHNLGGHDPGGRR